MKLAEKVLGKRLFKSLMGATFYGHFVAGEDEQAIKPIIERMRSFGVNAILNYSAEEDEGAARRGARNDPLKGDEDHLDRNVDIFLRCIEAVSSKGYHKSTLELIVTCNKFPLRYDGQHGIRGHQDDGAWETSAIG